MGIIGKQTIRSTVYSYLGIAVGFVTIGLLMPNIFTTAQNGLIGLLISYSVLAANIGQLGFNSATVKYFPLFRNEAKNHHGYLVLSILIAVVGSIVAVGAIYFLQIVDAGVEAHFVSFDVSEDLSLTIDPTFFSARAPGVTLSLNFH